MASRVGGARRLHPDGLLAEQAALLAAAAREPRALEAEPDPLARPGQLVLMASTAPSGMAASRRLKLHMARGGTR